MVEHDIKVSVEGRLDGVTFVFSRPRKSVGIPVSLDEADRIATELREVVDWARDYQSRITEDQPERGGA